MPLITLRACVRAQFVHPSAVWFSQIAADRRRKRKVRRKSIYFTHRHTHTHALGKWEEFNGGVDASLRVAMVTAAGFRAPRSLQTRGEVVSELGFPEAVTNTLLWKVGNYFLFYFAAEANQRLWSCDRRMLQNNLYGHLRFISWSLWTLKLWASDLFWSTLTTVLHILARTLTRSTWGWDTAVHDFHLTASLTFLWAFESSGVTSHTCRGSQRAQRATLTLERSSRVRIRTSLIHIFTLRWAFYLQIKSELFLHFFTKIK